MVKDWAAKESLVWVWCQIRWSLRIPYSGRDLEVQSV